MPLSKGEKAAGRAFREASQLILNGLNARDPRPMDVLTFHVVVRHECRARAGASVGITLREHYDLSPEYWLCPCGAVSTWGLPLFPHGDCPGGAKVVAAAGLFAWIWKEGRCFGCGRAGRSSAGRLVVATDRPARERRQASARPGDSGLPRA